jgi:hypothetical protein
MCWVDVDYDFQVLVFASQSGHVHVRQSSTAVLAFRLAPQCRLEVSSILSEMWCSLEEA